AALRGRVRAQPCRCGARCERVPQRPGPHWRPEGLSCPSWHPGEAMSLQPDAMDWAKAGGLLPLIAQHAHDGRVLMVGCTNRDALALTLETGEVHYWSRSRQRIWRKGETSGHVL